MPAVVGFLAYSSETNLLTLDISANDLTGLTTTNSVLTLVKGNSTISNSSVSVPLTAADITGIQTGAKTYKKTFDSETLAKLFRLDYSLDTITVSGVFNGTSFSTSVGSNLSVTLTEYLLINDVVCNPDNTTQAIMTVRGNPSLSGQTIAQLVDSQGYWISYTFTQTDLNNMNAALGVLYKVTIPGVKLGSTYYGCFLNGSNYVQKTKPIIMVTNPAPPQFLSYSINNYNSQGNSDISMNYAYPTTQQMGYDASANVRLSYWLSNSSSPPKCTEVNPIPPQNTTNGVPNGTFTVATSLPSDKLYTLSPYYENTAGSSQMQPPIPLEATQKPLGVPSSTTLPATVVGNSISITSVTSSDASMNSYYFEFTLLQGSQLIQTKRVAPVNGSGNGVSGNGNQFYKSMDMSFNNLSYGNYSVTIQAFNDKGGSPIYKSAGTYSLVGNPAAVTNLVATKTFSTTSTTPEQQRYLNKITLTWNKGTDTNNAPVSGFGVYAKADPSDNDLIADYLGYVYSGVNNDTSTTYTFDMSNNALIQSKYASKKLVLYVASVYDASTNYYPATTPVINPANPISFIASSTLSKKTYVYTEPVVNIQSGALLSSTTINDISYNQMVTSNQSTLVIMDWKNIVSVNNLPNVVYTITNSTSTVTYATNIPKSNYTFSASLPVGSNYIKIIPSYLGQGSVGAGVPADAKVFTIIVQSITSSSPQFPVPNPAAFYKDSSGYIVGARSVMADISNNLPPTYKLLSLQCTSYNEYGDDCSGNTILAASLPALNASFIFPIPISANGIYTNKVIANFTDGSNNYFTESSSSPSTIVTSTLDFGSRQPTINSSSLTFNVIRGALPGIIEVYLIDTSGAISPRILDDFIAGNGDSVLKTFNGANLKGAVIILRSGEQSLVRIIQTA